MVFDLVGVGVGPGGVGGLGPVPAGSETMKVLVTAALPPFWLTVTVTGPEYPPLLPDVWHEMAYVDPTVQYVLSVVTDETD